MLQTIARFYPKLFRMYARGHLVFLGTTDFRDNKEFDDATRVVQGFANILNDIEARTAMSRQGVAVECPFGLSSCNTSTECVHCIQNPADLTKLWDRRLEPTPYVGCSDWVPAYSQNKLFY